jgi:hypothetical protein
MLKLIDNFCARFVDSFESSGIRRINDPIRKQSVRVRIG